MTIWAEQPQIGQLVVVMVPVDVIEFKRDLAAKPLMILATATDWLDQSRLEKAALQFRGWVGRAALEYRVETANWMELVPATP